MKKKFNIIVACSDDGGISISGLIPWPIDYFFIKKTIGKNLLVGSRTKLPKLPHRDIIIAERQISFEDYLGKFNYLIGGKIMYNIGMRSPACKKIYITRTGNHQCDLFIPEFQNMISNNQQPKPHHGYALLHYGSCGKSQCVAQHYWLLLAAW